jgi:hypothetical protein
MSSDLKGQRGALRGSVECRADNVAMRSLLFVQGNPVASDSPEALTSTRQGDLTTVRVGADERFDIPDALCSGVIAARGGLAAGSLPGGEFPAKVVFGRIAPHPVAAQQKVLTGRLACDPTPDLR